ncbi:hypothetical protein [Streptomyces sp. NBC_01563]|uniref:hypothetical protein n=1 Tax=Streptomyces sp. NBC_01563 TaxID=2975880 RepID=UPI00386EFEDD
MTSQRNHTPARLLIATAILGTSVALTVPAPASAATSTVYAQTRPTPARQAPIADTRMRPAQAGSIISSRRVADLTASR